MSYPDIVVHGIRFHWDYDAEEYCAQVTPEDIQAVWDKAREEFTDGNTVQLPKSVKQAETMRDVATFYLDQNT